MKRFLSIDWDYFINATADERFRLFPDGGNENLPRDLLDYIWKIRYDTEPELAEIGVIEEVGLMKQILEKALDDVIIRSFKDKKPPIRSLVTDSHLHIYDLIINNTEPKEEFEVYNVDFHHDLYNYRTQTSRVNCGNWGTCLQEDRPNMKFHWVKREDSDTEVIGGFEVECTKNKLEELQDLDYDFVFLCRSGVWSPPHLDRQFIKLAKMVMSVNKARYEVGIDRPRSFDHPNNL